MSRGTDAIPTQGRTQPTRRYPSSSRARSSCASECSTMRSRSDRFSGEGGGTRPGVSATQPLTAALDALRRAQRRGR
jgi:hypothetical protein